MRCLCVVCALSVRCLCAVCALSAPPRHDAPRMYELGVPVLLGEKPTARRQNLSRSPMTLPNFPDFIGALSGHYPPACPGAGTPGRLRVCAACVLLASHRHDAPGMYAGARFVRRGDSSNLGARAASPTRERTSLFGKCKSLICASNFWNLQVLPFVALTLHPKWPHLHFFPYRPEN